MSKSLFYPVIVGLSVSVMVGLAPTIYVLLTTLDSLDAV